MKLNDYIPARLRAPRFSKTIVRDRLHHQLDEDAHYRGHWIFGPAGSGKTTLVSTYLHERKIPCIWFQIDITDNDLAGFFQNMNIAAAQAVSNEKAAQLECSPGSRDVAEFSRLYFSRLYRLIDQPMALVFDDVHAVGADSPLLAVLQGAFDTAPEHVHLYFTSRFEPHKLFTRFYVSSQLAVMGWRNLSFTYEETQSLIAAVTDQGLPKDTVQLIHAKTSGWAAGIRILAKHTTLDVMGIHALKNRVPSAVFDYFSSELFDQIAPNTQYFLFATSMLPPFSAETAQAVTGYDNAELILNQMVHSFAFINAKNSGGIYEYHSLYRQFLINKAKKHLTQEELERLQDRAARIYETKAQYDIALGFYQDAGYWADAHRLLRTCAAHWLKNKQYHTLEQALGRMPQQMLETDAWLMMFKTRIDRDAAHAQQAKIFERCYDQFAQQGDEEGKAQAVLGHLEACLRAHADSNLIDRWLAQSSHRAASMPPSALLSVTDAGIIGSVLAVLSLHRPDHPRLGDLAVGARQMAAKGACDKGKIQILAGLILHDCIKGDLESAAQMVKIAGALEIPEDITALRLGALRESLLLFHLLDGSFSRHKKAGCFRIDSTGIEDRAPMLGSNDFYPCADALGNWKLKAALKHSSRLPQVTDAPVHGHAGHILILRGWTAVLENEPEMAVCYARQALQALNSSGKSYVVAIARILLAIAHMAENENRKALEQLDRAWAAAQKINADQLAYQCHLIRAELMATSGDPAEALASIRQAFDLGRRKGYHNTWFWRPKEMGLLCGRAIEAGIETAYARKLIEKRKLPPAAPHLLLEQWPWPVKIRTLNKLSMTLKGKSFQITQKTRKMPIKFLMLLIAMGGRGVAAADMRDILWPDADGDVAANRYKITLHRLHKMLGRSDAVITSQGQLSLNPLICWVDIWPIEKLLREATMQWTATDESQDAMRVAVEKTIELSRRLDGPFLPDSKEIAIMQRREKIKQDYINCLMRLGAFYEKAADWPAAVELYNKGVRTFADIEYFYQRLIYCYHNQGNGPEARSAYDLCKKNISLYYCIRPSKETENLMRAVGA